MKQKEEVPKVQLEVEIVIWLEESYSLIQDERLYHRCWLYVVEPEELAEGEADYPVLS